MHYRGIGIMMGGGPTTMNNSDLSMQFSKPEEVGEYEIEVFLSTDGKNTVRDEG